MTAIRTINDIDLAGNIRAACENMVDVHYRSDYSGRGMYGKNCVAITGTRSDCMKVLAAIIVDCQFYCDLFPELVELLLQFQEDRMGYDVVFYWPGVEASDQDDTDNTDLDDEAVEDTADGQDPFDIEYDR